MLATMAKWWILTNKLVQFSNMFGFKPSNVQFETRDPRPPKSISFAVHCFVFSW